VYLVYLYISCLLSLYSDLEVAQSQIPKNVELLAREIDLLPEEVDLYGKKKAKVSLSVLKRLQDQKDGRYIVVTGYIH
jgi:methylenetetrahydrofolate dehydrogenase (NADP+)/methenyltetrahydrofolate cyclohydrolase/formyltetrahydrofolate synthetase